MAEEIDALPLIRTKLEHPRLAPDLVCRPQLLDRLQASSGRKPRLISATASSGKTALHEKLDAAGIKSPDPIQKVSLQVEPETLDHISLVWREYE